MSSQIKMFRGLFDRKALSSKGVILKNYFQENISPCIYLYIYSKVQNVESYSFYSLNFDIFCFYCEKICLLGIEVLIMIIY